MMSPEQIQAAHQRAEAVVNGFARVRDQQARDVIALTAHVAQLTYGQELLIQRLHELRERPAPAGPQPSFSDAFDQIFGDLFKDKK